MTLETISLAVGAAYVVAHLPLVAAPGPARKALAAFPRSAWAGRLLSALALAWSALLVKEMPLGWFDAHKDWLYVAGPLAYILVVLFMDELLASRALGGLFLLMAEPVLAAAREPLLSSVQFHPGWARLVPVLLAYGWVGIGTALVLAPYWFRKGMERLCGSDSRCRLFGLTGLAIGILLIVLALAVFA
jgi:hypothetical protein